MNFILPAFITSPTDQEALFNCIQQCLGFIYCIREQGSVICKICICQMDCWAMSSISSVECNSKIFTSGHCNSHDIVHETWYGANVSPCRTPATIGKKFVLPYSVTTWATVSIYSPLMPLMIWDGNP